jgi:hypothetical protein
MRLEDLRGRRVGDIVMFLDGAPLVPAAFHDHTQQAQWHTINSLIRRAGNSTDGVANECIAVVEWWRTIESRIRVS